MKDTFPKLWWEYSPQTTDYKLVIQKLEELQRQVEQLRQELYCIKRGKPLKIKLGRSKK